MKNKKIGLFGEGNGTANPAIRRCGRLFLFLAIFLVAGCQYGLPKESGHFLKADPVEVVKLDPTIRLDVRYATADNFTGRPIYTQARAFLQRPAAEALVRANLSLREQGYGIVIFDAYRPWSVTKALWEAASPSDRENGFVADPREGSKHNRGCAVDVSLFALDTGSEVEMPSGFDEFSERAFPAYPGGSPESRRLRDLLRQAMEAEGFDVSNEEWWHFNYRDWRQYRLMDVPFEALGAAPEPSRAAPTLDRLLLLVRQRLALMHAVARSKWNEGKPVADRQRELALLDTVTAKARDKGLDPVPVQAFFAAQIEAAKLIQQADFDRWRAADRKVFPDIVELSGLRSRIDALNDGLIDALAAAGPLLSCPSVRQDLPHRAERIVVGDGFDAAVRGVAIGPLLRFGGGTCQTSSMTIFPFPRAAPTPSS
jgi:D-alanyl-D-alanine dipeptidase